jgi:hypothetical protein
MKKIIIALLMSAALTSAFAQQTASEKAQGEACDCLNKIDKKTVNTPDKIEKATTQCLVTAMTVNIVGLAEENGYQLSEINEETGQAIGEKFGMQLALSCPKFLEFSAGMADNLTDEQKKSSMDRMRGFDNTGSVSGTFVRLDVASGEPKIVIKNASNVEESFLWIRRFDGSLALETDPKAYAGKKVTIQWGEFERFDAKTRTYKKVREITKISAN